MGRLLTGVLIVGALVSFEAQAQYRGSDAALGAVSGAVVLGPIGAAAGAIIGYTAGPSIARSWGLGRSASRSRPRRIRQSGVAPQEQVSAKANAAPAQAAAGPKAPPVQGFD